MKHYISFVLFLFLAGSYLVFGQQARGEIKFEKEQHNFGVIQEADGPVTHVFEFTNTGAEPLVITNVRATAGCTVPEWTRQPVRPGEKGSIKVVFNPRNMPGRFNKSMVVSSTAMTSNKVLRVLGEVIPRERTIEDEYPFLVGSLRFRTNHMGFGTMSPTETKTDSLLFVNLTEQELSLSFPSLPRHLTVKAIPETVKPGEKGKLEISFNAEIRNDWGVVSDYFQMIISDNPVQRNYMYSSANIQEDFSKLTDKQRENAPAISFENTTYDFGKLKSDEKVEFDYVFTNTGKSDLLIRKVRAGCGCTAISPTKTVLKPGESSSVKAVFNARGQRGRQNKGITVLSNDPAKPSVILRITGEVLTE
jgi:hypothetical protein